MNRRNFLVRSLGACTLLLGNVIPVKKVIASEFDLQILDWFSDHRGMIKLTTEANYAGNELDLSKSMAAIEQLAASKKSKQDFCLTINNMISSNFEKSEVINVNGWTLSNTELALCEKIKSLKGLANVS